MKDSKEAAKSEEVELHLHDMAHGGEAVGRLEDGRAVFVAGGIKGERVRARIVETRKRWCRAELIEVLEPSPDRTEAPCPVFDDCGGCQWQHITVSRQREMKRDVIRGQLEHLGGFSDPPVEEVESLGNEDGFGYRNHATFAVDAEGRSCYHRSASRELVPVDDCALLHPLIREPLRSFRNLKGLHSLELRCGTRTGDRIALVRGIPSPETQRTAALAGVSLSAPGTTELNETIANEEFRISSKSFFQVNSDGAERLVEWLMEVLAPKPTDVAFDLYAGVGLFTLPLARICSQVHAVEHNGAALRDLRRLSRRLPVEILGMPVEATSKRLPKSADLIVANPPRDGLGAETVKLICKRAPRTIVLVACDPAALARDARGIVAGGYVLQRVRPIDLFPHTFHIEALAVFSRAKSDATV